jgi:hypothetical protein
LWPGVTSLSTDLKNRTWPTSHIDATFKLEIINTETEYKRMLAAIGQLWGSKPGTEEHDTLEVLPLLVED